MAKYIKLDDLIPLLDWDHDEQSWYINPEELEHLEANALDAVSVVRCKDCKYAHSGNGIWYWCGTDERKRPGSFYCSAGRKKDEYDDQP